MSSRTENALGSEARDGLMTPAAVSLVDAISAATTSASVGMTGKRLPEVVTKLVRAELAPFEVARVVTDLIDAMTRRLIDLAIAEYGEPPVPWAWLALGSAARREQGIGTDQDHALAYDHQGRPLDELDGYFRHVAEYVTSGLEGAGIPRCNADVVAANQALRRPLEHWVEAFEAWMSDPRIESVRQTTILFDYRRVAGSLDAERTLRCTISSSSELPAFVGRLKELARDARPRRHLRLPRRIDLKHDGLMQIVTVARILAMEGDVPNVSTIERLRRAAELGLLDRDIADRLGTAFRLMWRARLANQIETAAGRRESGDLATIRPTKLRAQIGDALRAIGEAQDAVLRRSAVPATIRRDTGSPNLAPA